MNEDRQEPTDEQVLAELEAIEVTGTGDAAFFVEMAMKYETQSDRPRICDICGREKPDVALDTLPPDHDVTAAICGDCYNAYYRPAKCQPVEWKNEGF